MSDRQSDQRFGFLPWEFRHHATDVQKADQKELQNQLATSGEVSFGDEVYVAESAGVYCSRLVLGDRVYIGGARPTHPRPPASLPPSPVRRCRSRTNRAARSR